MVADQWASQKDLPGILRRLTALTIVIGLLIYLGLNVRGIFSAPPLNLDSPSDNSVSTETKILVKGETAPETRVQINGNEVISNIRGGFEETLNLNPGLNIITIKAIKKYGQSTTLIRNVFFKEQKDLSLK